LYIPASTSPPQNSISNREKLQHNPSLQMDFILFFIFLPNTKTVYKKAGGKMEKNKKKC
jgi:hypothetical protein